MTFAAEAAVFASIRDSVFASISNRQTLAIAAIGFGSTSNLALVIIRQEPSQFFAAQSEPFSQKRYSEFMSPNGRALIRTLGIRTLLNARSAKLAGAPRFS